VIRIQDPLTELPDEATTTTTIIALVAPLTQKPVPIFKQRLLAPNTSLLYL